MASTFDRRTALKFSAGAAAAALVGSGAKSAVASATVIGSARQASGGDGYIDLARKPDEVSVALDFSLTQATPESDRWTAGAAEVTTTVAAGGLVNITLTAKAPVRQIRLKWRGDTSSWRHVLGDAWERAYADLEWRSPLALRPAPWYLLATTEAAGTHSFGVRTGANAFCFWRHDGQGIELVCDVRSGGAGVELNGRTLQVCTVLSRKGMPGESAFVAQGAFCKSMCPNPRRTAAPVYGFNDWYYAYGKNSPAGLIGDSQLLGDLTAGLDNRPYSVIDDGWQTQSAAKLGQWSETRKPFGSMAELAAAMKEKKTRPGIWMRPLLDELKTWPSELKLSRNSVCLDPSLPAVREIVATDIKRITDWGYEMIKHDFSTFDLLGRWGANMNDGEVTGDGWALADKSMTTCEAINALYKAIRDAAGDKAVVIGCNTVSHLTAGMFEVNRIGDDTSGNEWHRNRDLGVNSLAFRGAHEGAFYGADADCCPITDRIEWKKLRQWLDLVSRSGTPLFVSCDRKVAKPQMLDDLKIALIRAAKPQPLGEPLDWLKTRAPREWKLNGETFKYDWS